MKETSLDRASLSALGRWFNRIADSRWNYRVSYLADIGLPIAFAAVGGLSSAGDGPAAGGRAFGAFAAGLLIATFIEYAFHRWLFHGSFATFAAGHAIHHGAPRRPLALPFFTGPIVATGLWVLVWGVAGGRFASFLMSGVATGYAAYGVVHHLQHHLRAASLPLGALRRRWLAHAVHHGRVDCNFGVTSSLWDRIFGTYRPPLAKPAIHAGVAPSHQAAASRPDAPRQSAPTTFLRRR